MYLALVVGVLIAAAWIVAAAAFASARKLSFHQAFLHMPIKLLHRVEDRPLHHARTEPPVIYAVLHQSRLDPALMLSLLPADTLHILDDVSARSAWLEPWREMARTIAFNAAHVFVSRRLVRHLRGRGRLAVYFPDGIRPDTRGYRLYRAVAKIAAAAEARIVPVSIQGSRQTLFALGEAQDAPRRPLAKLRVRSLEPLTIAELVTRSPREQATMAGALYDRVLEADAA
jgi:acyl-[acyl-carrier-protein]-phospholipid O-acyltransferase / long-chain-fatty-acid--[acyl-carrier-protein] ligase